MTKLVAIIIELSTILFFKKKYDQFRHAFFPGLPDDVSYTEEAAEIISVFVMCFTFRACSLFRRPSGEDLAMK